MQRLHWLLTSVGVVMLAAGLASVARGDYERGDRLRPLDSKELPDRVKDALSRDYRDRVDQVVEVRRGDRLFYRVRTRDEGTVLMDADGRILQDEGLGTARELRYEDLPGPVKTTLARSFGDNRIRRVTEINRSGRVLYRAQVQGEGMITVNSDGRIVDDEATNWGREIPFAELPGPVKTALARDFGGNRIDRVVQVPRGEHVVYRAMVRDQGLVTVDDRGQIINDNTAYLGEFGGGGRALNWAELPDPVKRTLADHWRDRVTRVIEIPRDGRSVYQCRVRDGGVVTLDDRGEILGDQAFGGRNMPWDQLPAGVRTTLSHDYPNRIGAIIELRRGQYLCGIRDGGHVVLDDRGQYVEEGNWWR